jgi:hypothetical protein
MTVSNEVFVVNMFFVFNVFFIVFTPYACARERASAKIPTRGDAKKLFSINCAVCGDLCFMITFAS